MKRKVIIYITKIIIVLKNILWVMKKNKTQNLIFSQLPLCTDLITNCY